MPGFCNKSSDSLSGATPGDMLAVRYVEDPAGPRETHHNEDRLSVCAF